MRYGILKTNLKVSVVISILFGFLFLIGLIIINQFIKLDINIIILALIASSVFFSLIFAFVTIQNYVGDKRIKKFEQENIGQFDYKATAMVYYNLNKIQEPTIIYFINDYLLFVNLERKLETLKIKKLTLNPSKK